MIGFLSALLIIPSSFTVGCIINALFLKVDDFLTRWEKIVFNTALGVGGLSFIILGLGFTGLIYREIFGVLLGILTLSSIFFWKLDRASVGSHTRFTVLEKVIFGVVLLVSASHLVLSFIPVTNTDALNHLLPPLKMYIQQHTIYNLSQHILYSNYPQLIGMLDMVVMALGDEIAVHHVHALLGLLTCAVVYVTVRKMDNVTSALLSVLILITSSVFFDMASSAKIDMGIALFAALTFYALMNWRIQHKDTWFYVSIISCAFALGVKQNGGFLLIFPITFLLIRIANERRMPTQSTKLVVYSIVIYGALVSPWFIKNFIFTGNPFSPFGTSLFHDLSVTPEMSAAMKTHFSSLKSNAIVYAKDVLFGTPILFFTFFIKRDSNAGAKIALLLGVCYFIIGSFVFPHVDRAFFPAFLMLFLVVGTVMGAWVHAAKSMKRTFVLVIFTAIVLSNTHAIGNEMFRKENFPYLTGKQSKDEFLKARIKSYPITMPVNASLGIDKKILSLSETRSYYFNQQFIESHCLVGYTILSHSDPDKIVASMKENNIEYLLFSTEPYYYRRQPPCLNDEGNLNRYFELVFEEGSCRLYRVCHKFCVNGLKTVKYRHKENRPWTLKTSCWTNC